MSRMTLYRPWKKRGYSVAVTCPDLDEPKEYRRVVIFASES
jgi:hypothetical protein